MSTEQKKESETDLTVLAENISLIKKALRRNNPLLRAVAESRLYPILALVYGLIIVLFCLVIRDSIASGQADTSGLGQALPWIILILLLFMGGVIKVILTKRLSIKFGQGGFGKIVLTIFGGKTLTIYLSTSIALTAGIVFAIKAGHPWYILPLASFMVSIISFFMDILIDLIEYKIMGWIALCVGIFSLFLVESDPFLWAAIVAGGIFCGFGLSGIARSLHSGK